MKYLLLLPLFLCGCFEQRLRTAENAIYVALKDGVTACHRIAGNDLAFKDCIDNLFSKVIDK